MTNTSIVDLDDQPAGRLTANCTKCDEQAVLSDDPSDLDEWRERHESCERSDISHVPLPIGAVVQADWHETDGEYRIISGHTWEVLPANELPDPRTFLVTPYVTQHADGTFNVDNKHDLPLVYVDELLRGADPAGAVTQDCLSLTAPVARKLASALVAAADQLDGWLSGAKTGNWIGQRPAGGRAKNEYFTDEFLADLDKFCRLPEDRYGEWYDVVRSSWIGGIKPSWRSGGQDDPNATVVLSRAANNEPEYGAPIVEHEVRLDLTKASLYMCPESAISLGHHLIAAGTAAMRDLARHATWLLPVPEAVPTDGS